MGGDLEEQLKHLFAAYVEAKQSQNVLDYDDLLLYWAQMSAIRIWPRYRQSLRPCDGRDEYQDTNSLQASVLMALKPGGRGLTVGW